MKRYIKSTVIDPNDLPVPEQVDIFYDEYLRLAKDKNTSPEVLNQISLEQHIMNHIRVFLQRKLIDYLKIS